MKNKIILLYIALISLLVLMFGFSLCTGAEKISLKDTFLCFFELDDFADKNDSENIAPAEADDNNHTNQSINSTVKKHGDPLKFKRIIVMDIRLPRILLVIITGMLLGGSGAIFQMYFRNSLAEPALLGISSGATMAAVFSITLLPAGIFGSAMDALSPGGSLSSISSLSAAFPYLSTTSTAAFVGALFAGIVIMLLAFTPAGSSNTILLLLCGTALGTLYSAISSLILITHTQELVNTYGWLMGSFNGHGWNELRFILLPAVIAFALMALLTTKLDYLNGGEDSALALGIDVNKTRICVLICGSLAVSASVCAGGTIGFIGLMAPHIIRRLAGPQAKRLIPLSVFCGAILLLASDTVARTIIAPAELPAGIITSILGVPFFLSLVLCKRSVR